MARHFFTVPTDGELDLNSTSPKTLLQIKASTHVRVAIKAFQASFDGVTSTAGPALLELVKQTSSGSFVAATGMNLKPSSETIQAELRKWTSTSTEPSDTGTWKTYNVHPQTGVERSFPEDEEIVLAGGERFGLRVTLSSAGPKVAAFVDCEE